jgi:hypothetical protein
MELMQASRQWATRPDDERFTSLNDMSEHFEYLREHSRELVLPSRRLHVKPALDNRGLTIVNGDSGEHGFVPTHWAFGQLAALGEAPAGYLRTMPSPIVADCLNYGFQFKRNIEDVGLLLQKTADSTLRAATGPRYGRIWNDDVVGALIRKFGDGVTGPWKVPGEFGRDVPVTVENTTLYAGDRDMFVFLANERNRIELPRRRNGQPGSFARGFFMWNSEVGSSTFGLATFLFDYVCQNRIVWGADEYREIRIRHTASAPDKYIEEMLPALDAYAAGRASNVVEAIEQARSKRLDDKLDEFLSVRFGKRLIQPLKLIHEAEEGRPIETLWDVTVAATAYARSIRWQDERVDMERKAGEVMRLAA